MVEAVRGKIISRSGCEEVSCPPNGTNYIGSAGKCFSKVPYYLKNTTAYEVGKLDSDGHPILCPYFTTYHEQRQACILMSC